MIICSEQRYKRSNISFAKFSILLNSVRDRVLAYKAAVRGTDVMPATHAFLGKNEHPLFQQGNDVMDRILLAVAIERHLYNNPSLLLFATQESRDQQYAELSQAISVKSDSYNDSFEKSFSRNQKDLDGILTLNKLKNI